jgi:hypothetical protein
VVEELLFDVVHDTEQYANNRVETDHGRLKARLRPMRGLKRDRTASVVIRGHAFIQNLRRGHYEARCQRPQPAPPSSSRVRRTRRGDLTRRRRSTQRTRPPIEQRNSAQPPARSRYSPRTRAGPQTTCRVTRAQEQRRRDIAKGPHRLQHRMTRSGFCRWIRHAVVRDGAAFDPALHSRLGDHRPG